MADTEALAKFRGKITTVEGRKVLVFGTGGGRQLQDRAAVQQRIAMLDNYIGVVIPEAKSRIDGAELLAKRQAQLDDTIAKLQEARGKLTADELAAEAVKHADDKIARLSEVRDALASAVDELDVLPQE